MNTPIVDMLHELAGEAGPRFCMPGHKGKPGFLPSAVNCYDITEMPGADNLYMPQGAIKKAQDLHAEYIHARESFFLVNGSSGGIHAAALSVLRPGDKVIAARDVHLSAVNAFALAGAEPVFVYPSARATELPCVVSEEDMERAIAAHPDAKAVYITYPNYYGMCLDLNSICAAAHRAGMQVICDAAHSAAFDFSELLPVSPAAAGCDIWVVSLHKTLKAMNQCSVLCVGENANIAHDTVRARLNMLQTTSPSYVLLGSCDYALGYMREHGHTELAMTINLVEDNMRRIEALGGYRCVLQDIPKDTGSYDRDVLKLVIDVTDRGVSGFTAARLLFANGVVVEAADLSNIVLICTVADGANDFDLLKMALKNIKGSNYNIRRTMTADDLAGIFGAQPSVSVREAVFAQRRRIAPEESVGYVAAQSAGAYPPGVPVIMPGVKITEQMIDYLLRLKNNGYQLFGMDGGVEVACL